MSDVYFVSYTNKTNAFASALGGLQRLFTESNFEEHIPSGKPVLIKLHMGEPGNIRYLRPIFADKVIEIVKSKGGIPFLFDTTVNYPSIRMTKDGYLSAAAKNGFASLDAELLISDDDDEHESISVTKLLDGCQLSKVKVTKSLLNSPCVIVLSHVKGHALAGLGGAIKNLGMGCVSRETKQAQHYVNLPQFVEEDCDGCGICETTCMRGAITMVDGKAERDMDKCVYCGLCLIMCPSGGWILPSGSKEKLQLYLAHAANAVVSGCKGKIAYVNFIQDVVPMCDCMPIIDNPVVQDVGIAFSLDPVAIDKASLDLIDKSPIIPGSTSANPPDLLGKIHDTNSLIQLETAANLGVGSLEYDLLTV
jgi:uncharacterized Fe-S center protein